MSMSIWPHPFCIEKQNKNGTFARKKEKNGATDLKLGMQT